MQYVIVGAGPSGITAAEALRKQDPSSVIIIVDGEDEAPYGRMAIPYFLMGQVPEKGLLLRKQKNHFNNLDIRNIKGSVKKISTKNNNLTLSTGENLSFDKLLLAAGSIPVKPNIPGLDGANIYHCWTLQDARKIAEVAGKDVDIILLGAGFIGCIIMEALTLSGANLTVLEAEKSMVPRMMDETAGNLIKKWCLDRGVNILTSTRAVSVEEGQNKKIVELDSGERIFADLIVVATGVRPNIDFLDDSGIDVDQGVIINNQLRSNIENIYAAGDIAQGPDFSAPGWSVHAVQPTGVEHGRMVALSMTGKEINYQGSLNMNVLDTLGLISCSFGLWQVGDKGESVKRLDEENYRYTVLNFDDDRLVGALMVGRTDSVGVLRGLIQTSVKLGSWKDRLMLDPNQIVEAYIECTTAYNHINSYKKLLKKNAHARTKVVADIKKNIMNDKLITDKESEEFIHNNKKNSSENDNSIENNTKKIKVTLKLYAMLTKYLPKHAVKNQAEIKVEEVTNLQAILEFHRVPTEHCHLVLVNGHYAAPSERAEIILKDGDVVAVWPPVAGGSNG